MRRLPVQRTESGYPMATFLVMSKVVQRRFPAARAAKRRIPLNDVSDGVVSNFTAGEAADPNRRRP